MKPLHKISPYNDEVFTRLHAGAYFTRNDYYIRYRDDAYYISIDKTKDNPTKIYWSDHMWATAVKNWIQSGKPLSEKVIL